MQVRVRKFISFILCLSLFFSMVFIYNVDSVYAADTLTEHATGEQNGYSYELWKDSGNTSMTLGQSGTFSCSWSNINNALFRRGIHLDSTQTYSQLGDISVEYSCDYKPSGNSYLCVYGWSVDPLIEYYIVDSWGTWRPPGATSKGTISVDGGTYDIYETTRTNQPSIQGTATFKQYWSVRTDKRTSGTISVSEHFKQWEKLGMKLGKMYEVSFTVEGYQSSGEANITKNIVTIGGNTEKNEDTGNSDTNENVENNDSNNSQNTNDNSNSGSLDNNVDTSAEVYDNVPKTGDRSVILLSLLAIIITSVYVKIYRRNKQY